MCRSCYYHFRDLRRICKHLDISTATGLANALVSSRLDYCNSLFFAASNELLVKMQRVQNCLARVVTGASRYSSSAHLLKTLHWLPIESPFKTNLITCKALNLSKPAYLSNIIHPIKYNINLKAISTCTFKHVH